MKVSEPHRVWSCDMPVRILDLFAGAGGLSLGFEMVRDDSGKQAFELYRAVEIDKYCCETLRNRYGETKVIEGDLTKKAVHERVIRECKGRVSVVVGGIPCQSFSTIGPRSGYGRDNEEFKDDERDHLYREFRNIVGEVSPNIFVIENVKGILSKKDSGGRKIIDRIIADFEGMGYNLKNEEGKKYLILNAADYGVPQRRERVILIGIRKEWKTIDVPVIEPTHYDPERENGKESASNGLLPYVTLYDAIGDLPEVKPKITDTGLRGRQLARIKSLNKRIENGQEKISFDRERFDKHLKEINDSGKRYFDFVRSNGYAFIDHHVARSQQLTDIKLFRHMREGETAEEFYARKPELAKKLIKYKMDTFTDKYRKQSWNKPCTTVFAHLEKDGNRFIHPGQARTITPREAARIQSFPDDFIFWGPFSKKYRQIGNAVPPLMAYNIGLKIFEIMRKE
jgi:DNA (cytosine-5)-methyltransferase 1